MVNNLTLKAGTLDTGLWLGRSEVRGGREKIV